MSLFDFRDLIELNASGKFDPRACCPLSSGPVVVGTLDGSLDMYVTKSDDTVVLMHSLNLRAPVLQVKSFIYGNAPDKETFVVLCQRRLIGVQINIEDEEKPLKYLFEHKLNRDYYAMDVGGFDGCNMKSDLIFIISLSGVISLYKNETHIFQVIIPNLTLPSSIAYSSNNDMIIIQNRPFTISSYLQNTLAIMAESQKTKFVSQWECELPEIVTDLELADRKSTLFCKGTQSVFLVSTERGQVTRQIQMEGIRIQSMLTYDNHGDLMQIYATENNELIIYNGAQRVWSSATSMDLIGIKRVSAPLDGLLLLLGRNWKLRFGYLGTRPQLKALEATEQTRSLNEINQQIAGCELILEDKSLNESPKPSFDLSVTLNTNQHNNQIVNFRISLTTNEELDHATVKVIPSTDDFKIEFIDGDEFSAAKKNISGHIIIPNKPFSNTKVTTHLSAKTTTSEHQVFVIEADLPPTSWLKTSSSEMDESACLSLQLKNDFVAPLKSVFSEFTTQSINPNEIVFSLLTDETIKVRKLQGCMEVICPGPTSLLLITRFITRRCDREFKIGDCGELKAKIKSHFHAALGALVALSTTLTELKEQLAKQTNFLIALEKKMLVKLKLKNQAESNFMNDLLRQTMQSMAEIRRKLVKTDEKRRRTERETTTCLQLIFLTYFLEFSSANHILQLLENLEPEASNAAFMTKLESVLAYIGHQFGSSAIFNNNSDVTNIMKKLQSILTRVNEANAKILLESNNRSLNEPAVNTVTKVPLKG